MLLIHNIGLLQTPVGSFPHGGCAQGENRKIRNAAILAEDGIIREITGDGLLPRGAEAATEVVDARGSLVTPGLIDCHTHMVFGGWRQGEIPLKLKGAGYLDILQAGGGILDTVRHTREASREELTEKTLAFAREMLRHGVTTVESKSGYGLDMDTERKQLEVNRQVSQLCPMEVVSTFLGGHALPPEYKGKPEDYVNFVCKEVLPRVAEEHLAEFVDVFCEEGVFDPEQSRKMLAAGQALGLKAKIHADEIQELGGTAVAGEISAISAEHLIATEASGMETLAKGGVIADLLPATSFYLGKSYAQAREMIARGIPVAIATDFNPGSCPSPDLQLAMTLGYLRYRMTPEEILTAVTINAACSLNRQERLGTIEPGKQADLVIWDAPDTEMLVYRFGTNLARNVIKKGVVVV